MHDLLEPTLPPSPLPVARRAGSTGSGPHPAPIPSTPPPQYTAHDPFTDGHVVGNYLPVRNRTTGDDGFATVSITTASDGSASDDSLDDVEQMEWTSSAAPSGSSGATPGAGGGGDGEQYSEAAMARIRRLELELQRAREETAPATREV